MGKLKKLSVDEIKYILHNCNKYSILQISNKLDRSWDRIYRYIKRNKIDIDDEKINEINNSDKLKFRGSKSVKPINK